MLRRERIIMEATEASRTEPMEVDTELKKRIQETVMTILQSSSLRRMTEKKAREEASAQLNLDLSEEPYLLVVTEAVESFLEELIKRSNSKKGKEEEEKNARSGEQKKEGEKQEGKIKKKKKRKKKKKLNSSQNGL